VLAQPTSLPTTDFQQASATPNHSTPSKEFARMFRTTLLASAALVLAALVASPAQAQLNLRGLKFPAALQNVQLLSSEAVQKELTLNDDQKKEIADLATQLRQDAIEIFSGLQDLNPEEQKEQMPEIIKMIGEKGKEVQTKVDKVLDAKQVARMKELSIQSRGATALEDEEIVAALKIDDAQQKKLAELREEGNAAMQEAIEGLRAGGGDQGEIRKKIGELRKSLSEKALAALTPAQREQFDKLKGAEFKFPQGGGRGFPF
jgi:hypothetical protein